MPFRDTPAPWLATAPCRARLPAAGWRITDAPGTSSFLGPQASTRHGGPGRDPRGMYAWHRPASSRRALGKNVCCSRLPDADNSLSSARPSRRHYESDVYVPSKAASTFKKRHAASSYSPSSSAKRSTFFAEFATPSARPAHPGNPTERSVSRFATRNGVMPWGGSC